MPTEPDEATSAHSTSAIKRRRRLAAAAAATALVVLGACSTGGGGEGVASAGGEPRRTDSGETDDAAAADPDTQALRFAACMRDNGIDMPDPGPGPQGLGDAFQAVAQDSDRDTLQQALNTCQDLMPQYAAQEQHTDDVMLDLAECLREQGLDVSDDPFNDAHLGNVDVGEFSQAMEVCRDVLIRGGQ